MTKKRALVCLMPLLLCLESNAQEKPESVRVKYQNFQASESLDALTDFYLSCAGIDMTLVNLEGVTPYAGKFFSETRATFNVVANHLKYEKKNWGDDVPERMSYGVAVYKLQVFEYMEDINFQKKLMVKYLDQLSNDLDFCVVVLR